MDTQIKYTRREFIPVQHTQHQVLAHVPIDQAAVDYLPSLGPVTALR